LRCHRRKGKAWPSSISCAGASLRPVTPSEAPAAYAARRGQG
jgi:hypothetical protein